MGRLLGLLLILRGFAPFLIVLIVGFVLSVVINDLEAAVARPVATMRAEGEDMTDTFTAIGQELNGVITDVNAVVTTLNSFSLPNLLPNIPTQINFPSLSIPSVSINVPNPANIQVTTSSISLLGQSVSYPTGISVGTTSLNLNFPAIPALNVPLPGMQQVNQALDDVLDEIDGVFDVFDPVFSSLSELGTSLRILPDSFGIITTETQTLITNVQNTFNGWRQTLFTAVALIFILIVIYFGVSFLDDVTRGWRMLRGLPV